MELKTGNFPTTLDDKGRVGIPAKLRDRYSGELVITCGIEHCAWVMKPDVWEHVVEKLTNSDLLTEKERLLIEHKYINQAQVLEPDRAGRVSIPAPFRRYARLTKECLVISAENRLEIWDEEFFFSFLDENQEAVQAAINKMGSLKLFRMGAGDNG
ncbi:MAG: division/cell wall cluster transcriptional repressor MraZ [Spirochaetaceae bacterium]|nr:division/cell wall cluster transcriptional repressor MraZ [Spirochaetaceae bacterium]